jgi:hypothetical protein
MLAVLMSVEYSRATAVVSGGPPVESDIRLKRDITQVGELDSGVGLYRYRYLWKRHDLRRGHGAGSRGGNTRGSRGADGYLPSIMRASACSCRPGTSGRRADSQRIAANIAKLPELSRRGLSD